MQCLLFRTYMSLVRAGTAWLLSGPTAQTAINPALELRMASRTSTSRATVSPVQYVAQYTFLVTCATCLVDEVDRAFRLGMTTDARLVAGFHGGQRESVREFSAGGEDKRREGLRTDLWTAPGEVCLVFRFALLCLSFAKSRGARVGVHCVDNLEPHGSRCGSFRAIWRKPPPPRIGYRVLGPCGLSVNKRTSLTCVDTVVLASITTCGKELAGSSDIFPRLSVV